MTMAQPLRTQWPFAAIAGLLALSIWLQVTRDRGWTAYEPATPVMWLQSPSAVKTASLGFDALVADFYWMRAVVYFGRQSLSEDPNKNYDLLHPLLDLVTTLDPRFNVAYRFGAIFLSEPAPDGPGRPDLAIALLEKGFALNPHRWEYLHDIGFIYYWHQREFGKGAEYLERAATVPGAPVWLRSTAATMHADQGNRESARLLWRQIRDAAENDRLRAVANLRLQQLDAMDGIDQLNQIVRRFEQQTGRVPSDWRELIAARLIRGIPLDPAETPFEIDPAARTVRVSERSSLWPMPEGFAALAPR
jgi:tetratricopeptide (TPR) repeat protein